MIAVYLNQLQKNYSECLELLKFVSVAFDYIRGEEFRGHKIV